MRRAGLILVVLGLLVLGVIPVLADGSEHEEERIKVELIVQFACVQQNGVPVVVFDVDSSTRTAIFIVNGVVVGSVLYGGYGVKGVNTWLASVPEGSKIKGESSGSFDFPDCEAPASTTTTEATTTTVVVEATTTVAPTTTEIIPPPDDSTFPTTTESDLVIAETLPFTGPVEDITVMLVIGGLLMATGLTLTVWQRKGDGD